MSIEARRAAGESVPDLPVLVGGRPSLADLAAPLDLCTCTDRATRKTRHRDWCAIVAWEEVAPGLVEAKLLDRVDHPALRAYALHTGRARGLREEIEWEHHETCSCPSEALEEAPRALGAPPPAAAPPAVHVRGCRLGKRSRRRTLREAYIARSVRGMTANPLLAQEREALREARMMGELLGLNPVGRTRLLGKTPRGRGLAGLTANLPRPTLVKA